MKQALAVLCSVVLGYSGWAQCSISTSLSLTVVCDFVSVSVNTTGGTPPFTIELERRFPGSSMWSVSETFPNDADGDLTHNPMVFYWDGAEQGRVRVTDAMGCVAMDASMNFPPIIYRNFSQSTTPDCTTGLNRIELNFLGWWPTSQWTYALDAAPAQSFLSNWTLVGSAWRSNFTVSHGSHTLILPAYIETGTGWNYCTMWHSFTSNPIVTPGDCGANLSIRAALQGPLPSGTLMHDSLRVKNLIPTTQPYTALGYSYTAYTGATTIAPSVLTITGVNAIVDWVVVELRNSANSAQVLFSKPALLQRDGDVVDLDGDSYVNFPMASGNYHMALRHRNHLGIMTSTTHNLTPAPTNVDFRLSWTTCYGANARVQVGTIHCLWPGDANGNGTVAYTGLNNDRDPVLNAIGGVVPTNTLNNVYDRRDVNLDGLVKYTGANNDRDVILNTIGGVVPTNTRTQQLP